MQDGIANVTVKQRMPLIIILAQAFIQDTTPVDPLLIPNVFHVCPKEAGEGVMTGQLKF